MKPASEWTEDDVLSLPPGEDDTFERKGTALLDLTLPSVKEGIVLDELAKQLSAFANMGGGRIIYGLTNAGVVDMGGVGRLVKGRQSTKEWLEDVIPTLTDLEVVGFNVYEILPKASGSVLAPDKSIIVVDVPSSERAPHQSKRDLKYYVRLGGRSQPAPHRLIEDIRNRIKYPQIEIHDLRILNAVSQSRKVNGGINSEIQLKITLSFEVRNKGNIRASSACLRLASSVPLSLTVFGEEYFLRPASPGVGLIEIKNPLYPGMGIVVQCIVNVDAAVQYSPGVLTFSGSPASEVSISITSFADNAPGQSQTFQLSKLDSQRVFVDVIQQEQTRILNYRSRLPRGTIPPWN